MSKRLQKFAIIGLTLAVVLISWAFAEQVVSKLPRKEQDRSSSTNSYQPDCWQPKNNNEYDSCQQKNMVDAAWYQLCLSGFGLVGLLFTLIFSAKSAKGASDAALAAQESVTVARQHLDILERPYVVMQIEEVGIVVQSGGMLNFNSNRFTYVLKNYGRSVAFLTELRVDWPALKKGDFPDPIDSDLSTGRQLPFGVISTDDVPYREFEYLFRICDQKLLEETAWNKYSLYFIGYIKYQDAFGTAFVSGFCMVFDPLETRWVLRGDQRYNYQKKGNTA